MSPHGTKNSSKKAMSKGVSMTLNGPRMSSKKKRKLANENSDPEVLDRSAKYWQGLKIDASDDIKDKILKHLSVPSRRYKLKDEDLVLPAKKKRKLQKNGSLETDSDDEKNSKKGRLQMKKKQQYGESPSSKFRKWKKFDSELAAMSGTKNKSKKSASGDSCGKGKKASRQKLLSANYEGIDGVCIYDLDTPELKNKARKKKLMAERAKGANHLLNKKKVRVGKGVLTTKNMSKKQIARVRFDGANFKLLPKKHHKKLQKRYSVQMVSDVEASDSDNIPEKNISGSACKKNRTKMTKSKWADLNKKKAKFKKQLQDLEMPKSKKLKRQQVSEEDDDSEDDDFSSEEEDVSDEYMLEDEEDDIEDDDKEDDDKDDEEEEDEDEDDDDDDDDFSDDQTSDEKSGPVIGLSNGDWEKVNEEQIREVNQDAAYGNGWKTHEGEKPSSSSLLHPWSQNNGISTNNTYHHDPLVSQQQHHQPHQLIQAGNMAAGCISAQTISRPMTNTSNMLPPFGAVVDTATNQQHYPTQIQDNSTQAMQHFGDQQQQQQQQRSSYNLYSGVDYASQAPNSSYNNDGKAVAAQSQNFHLQHHLLQSQTHSFSGFNHLQSQQNNSSNVQKVKHYYPASIGKEGIMEVEGALRPVPPEEVLTQGFRISIKRCDMATLVGSNWLNDEIINFYMNLIVQRGKTEGFSSVYIPSTFFFPMVMKRGYNGVRRWTKNVDIFDHDLMLIPIHLEIENHWTLIAVDFLQSSICYYDSYLQDKDEAMDAILDYLKEEMKAKKNIEMDINCWVKVNMKNIPLQENLSDCGVFSCIYAEYISRGAQMDFTQEDMPYFRRKMVYEILHQKIVDHSPRDTENLISDDLLQDTCPAPNDISNLQEPPVALQNGLPDSSLSPTSNENSMKVNEENAGLTVNSKDLEEEEEEEEEDEEEEEEEICKDSDALQSSSDVEGEQKMLGISVEELKKRYSSRIVGEIKQIANVFEDADVKEQGLLLSQLRHLLKTHSRNLRRKIKPNKVGHRNIKELLLSGKGNSETDESEDVSSTSSTTTSSGNSSSGSMSSAGGSSEEETKSSDEANMSSNSDSIDQPKLSRMIWEVEKLLVSLTDLVRSIGKASSLMSMRKRLLDPSGSFSVIKGIEFISSELQNISNHYNQMLMNQSPKKTAVKKHVTPSPSHAKAREKKIVQCIVSKLSARHNKIQKRKMLKRLHKQKARERTKANVIPKKSASGDEEFSHDEVADRRLLARLIKDAGGHLLDGRPCTRKLQFHKSLLTKFPLPDGIFDLTCPTPEKGHKQAHKSLMRSDHGKKGKKKK